MSKYLGNWFCPQLIYQFQVCKLFDENWLTFLKVIRSTRILPKHLRATACCVPIKIIGKSFWISSGNKYQSNVKSSSRSSANASVTRWPRSQTTNTVPNVYDAKPIATNSIVESWCCYWNRSEIVWVILFAQRWFEYVYSSKYLTISIWINNITPHIAIRLHVNKVESEIDLNAGGIIITEYSIMHACVSNVI